MGLLEQIEKLSDLKGTPFFVIGRYRETDSVRRLVNEIYGADEMKNEVLTERLRLFKDRDSLDELSEVDARSVARGRAEGRAEARLEIVTKLIRLGQMSLERISEVSGLPIEELRKIKETELSHS